jgi:hypothetical protein
MKNQYVGDRNDYRKYGLLRALAEASALRLGVCWMLTADDGSTDGNFRSYLSQPGMWRGFDSVLYDGLRSIANTRAVSAIEATSLLGDARFAGEIVPDRADERRSWFANAIDRLSDCPLLFFDPDNGIEVRSCPPGRRKSSKYVAWHELEQSFARGHSLVIYQHFPRRERRAYIAELTDALSSRLGAIVSAYVTPSVVFFVAAQPGHAALLATAAPLIHARWPDSELRDASPLAACAKVPPPLSVFRPGT